MRKATPLTLEAQGSGIFISFQLKVHTLSSHGPHLQEKLGSDADMTIDTRVRLMEMTAIGKTLATEALENAELYNSPEKFQVRLEGQGRGRRAREGRGKDERKAAGRGGGGRAPGSG